MCKNIDNDYPLGRKVLWKLLHANKLTVENHFFLNKNFTPKINCSEIFGKKQKQVQGQTQISSTHAKILKIQLFQKLGHGAKLSRMKVIVHT